MRGIAPGVFVSRRWWRVEPGAQAESAIAVFRIAAVALAIASAQVAAALCISMAAGNGSPEHAYRAFCRRDGYMYAAILERGYRSTIPPTASVNFNDSNVAFFPGYPLLGRMIYRMSGGAFSQHASLVVAAQVAAWGFWTYWLLILRRLNMTGANAAAITLAAAFHPAAFFLVVAYSESLFLLGLCGFLYWVTSATSRSRWLAVPHGLVMTLTRLGGMPLVLAPFCAELCMATIPFADARQKLRRDLRRLGQSCAIGMLASLGGLAFFAFCQWRFGAWDLYFQTQREGQGVTADWLWFVRPSSYAFFGSVFYPQLNWTDDLSRLFVGLTVLAILIAVRKEWKLAQAGDQGWRARLVFYLCAAGLLFIHAAGVSPRHMQSMLRYCYPVHLLLLLAVAQAIGSRSLELRSYLDIRRLAIGLAASAVLQIALAYRFFQGGWVA
jgi:hypothetical protein